MQRERIMKRERQREREIDITGKRVRKKKIVVIEARWGKERDKGSDTET